MEFIKPAFTVSQKISGTYRLSFDDKWFYIGSSGNLRRRSSKWRHLIVKDRNDPQLQKSIKNILHNISMVRFEIIEIINDEGLRKESGTDLIISYWNNPLLLNICPSGENNKNRDVRRLLKPVNQINSEFEVINVYRNHFLAAEYLKCSTQFMIRACFERLPYKKQM